MKEALAFLAIVAMALQAETNLAAEHRVGADTGSGTLIKMNWDGTSERVGIETGPYTYIVPDAFNPDKPYELCAIAIG